VSEEQNETNVAKPLWEGWHQPTNPAEALELGLDYAKMEGLWCSGMLFASRDKSISPHNYRHKAFVPDPNGYAPTLPKNQRLCFCEPCVRARTWDERVEKQGLTCGDIKACSVGILIMSVLDGPAVAQYFKNVHDEEGEDIQEALQRHPVGGPSLIYLAAGMERIKRETAGDPDHTAAEEARYKIEQFKAPPKYARKIDGPAQHQKQRCMIEEAISEVIDYNDGGCDEGCSTKTRGEQMHDRIAKGFEYARDYARADFPPPGDSTSEVLSA
jgi:hypothetical protein